MESLLTHVRNHDFDQLSKHQLSQLSQLSSYHYHSTDNPLVDDYTYDLLNDYIQKHYPDEYSFLDQMIGAPISDTTLKVELPFWMGSLTKIKTDHEIQLWKRKLVNNNNVIVMDKLDGVSALFYHDGSSPMLVTRGNGSVGQNVSNLIQHINIPPITPRYVVRGELVISFKNFNHLVNNNHIKQTSHPRNIVAGAVNGKNTSCEILRCIDFVAYEIIDDTRLPLPPSTQLCLLNETSFKVVPYQLMSNKNITQSSLTDTLNTQKNISTYPIDGIVVFNDAIYTRYTSGNPIYAFAFKLQNFSSIKVTVDDVVWNLTKDKILYPVVIFPSIHLHGANIQRVTGNNAKFIIENKIGKGSIISITRSGDVIPKISNVIQPANAMIYPSVPYFWNDTGVHFVAIQDSNTAPCFDYINFENIIIKLSISGIKKNLTRKLFDIGIRNLQDLFLLNRETLMTINSIQSKSADAILHSIHTTLSKLSHHKLMYALNIFGRGVGEKTIKNVLSMYPNIFRCDDIINIHDICKVKGIDICIGTAFIAALPRYINFIKQHSLMQLPLFEDYVIIDKNNNNNNTTVNVVFTGKRNKLVIDKFISKGGSILTSMSSKVHYLVTDDLKSNSKINYAVVHNIPILSYNHFSQKFFVQV